jgi:hypothetical protein
MEIINLSELILSTTQSGGFDKQDSDIIVCYTETNTYTFFTSLGKIVNGKFIDEKYQFVLDKEKNNNKKFNSSYLGNGHMSTVFVVKCIVPDDKYPLLVLKLSFVKDRTDSEHNKWNKMYYDEMYTKQKEILGNGLANLFFYGDKVTKNPINIPKCKPDNYDKFMDTTSNKHLVFSMYQYYDSGVLELKNRYECLLKFVSLLYHCRKLDCCISDCKYANIKFDTKFNTVLIDYSEKLLAEYIIRGKHIIQPDVALHMWCPCYIKKKTFFLLKLKSQLNETLEDIERRVRSFPTTYNKDDIKDKHIKANIVAKTLLIDNIKDKEYDFQFDKLNSVSIVDIILNLFFQKAKMKDLYLSKEIMNNIGQTLLLHKLDQTKLLGLFLPEIACIHNINDIDMLVKYLGFISPIGGIPPEIINMLKSLMFDEVTECGLLAPDYENIPPYELAFKFLMDQFKILIDQFEFRDKDVYQSLKQMLDENIGIPAVTTKTSKQYHTELNTSFKITNVGKDVIDILVELGLLKTDFDSITYEQWKFARLVEQLMYRSEYRTDSNLEIPPVNSTLPQSQSQPKPSSESEQRKQMLDKLPVRINASNLVKLIEDPTSYKLSFRTLISALDINKLWELEEIKPMSTSALDFKGAVSKQKLLSPLTAKPSAALQEIKRQKKIAETFKKTKDPYFPLPDLTRTRRYYYKYLKYKTKYLELKKLLNEI